MFFYGSAVDACVSDKHCEIIFNDPFVSFS